MHPEQEAFEKQIDANPLDGDNHLIYADWLDEHGQPDEAAFRRAMGNWMKGHHASGTSPHVREYWSRGSDLPRTARRFVMPWRVTSDNVPQGVNLGHVENWNTMPHENWQFRTNGTGYFPKDPAHASFEWLNARKNISMRLWENYRGMEEGLRRAFMKGRQQNQVEQFRRRMRARRFSLKNR